MNKKKNSRFVRWYGCWEPFNVDGTGTQLDLDGTIHEIDLKATKTIHNFKDRFKNGTVKRFPIFSDKEQMILLSERELALYQRRFMMKIHTLEWWFAEEHLISNEVYRTSLKLQPNLYPDYINPLTESIDGLSYNLVPRSTKK